MLDNFNAKLVSRGLHVRESMDPEEIILTGEKCGLEDVKHWVTNNHLEKLIDTFESEPGLYGLSIPYYHKLLLTFVFPFFSPLIVKVVY